MSKSDIKAKMDTKAFSFNLKAVGEPARGEFTGYAAIYGTEDRNGEIIDAGAMKRSINANDGEFPLLWQHNRETPIGVVKLEDVQRGAKAVGRISLESSMGSQAYSLMIPPEGFKRAALRDRDVLDQERAIWKHEQAVVREVSR